MKRLLLLVIPILLLSGCATMMTPRMPESAEGKPFAERKKAYDTYKLNWEPRFNSVQQGWMTGNEVASFKELGPLFAQSDSQAATYYSKSKTAQNRFVLSYLLGLGVMTTGEVMLLTGLKNQTESGGATTGLGAVMMLGGIGGVIGSLFAFFDVPKQLKNAADAYNDNLYARYALDKPDGGIAIAGQPGVSVTQTPIPAQTAPTRAPVIVITSPQVKRGLSVVAAAKTVLVEGQVVSEAGLYEVSVNGMEARLEAGGSFSAEARLALGENQVLVKAIDVKGNETTLVFQVTRNAEAVTATARPEPATLEAQPAPLARKGKDYALLFATDSYREWDKLANPVNDARTLAKELRDSYGFEVDTVVGTTQEQILSKLYDYADRRYQPEDQLFVFFAGHGQFDDVTKMGYVVASDSARSDLTKRSYISHSEIRDRLDAIPCSHVFLAMDVCFGGTFDRTVAMRGVGDDLYSSVSKSEFIQRKLQYKTRKYLTSGGKTYVPDGRPGQHSPFAARLLEALRSYGGKDGILTFGELLAGVEGVNPQPMAGDFGSNEPGSDFIFIAR